MTHCPENNPVVITDKTDGSTKSSSYQDFEAPVTKCLEGVDKETIEEILGITMQPVDNTVGRLKVEHFTVPPGKSLQLNSIPNGDIAVFKGDGTVQELGPDWAPSVVAGDPDIWYVDLTTLNVGDDCTVIYTIEGSATGVSPTDVTAGQVISEEKTFSAGATGSFLTSFTILFGTAVQIKYGGVVHDDGGVVTGDGDYTVVGNTITRTATSDIPEGATVTVTYQKAT
jgi:hypothetical protein